MPAPAQVTIAVPTRNKAKYLLQSLHSILRQTHTAFQLIMVDDASEDETSKIAFSIQDPRFTYLRNETPRDMTSNWNRCLQVALETHSPYIGIFHDDDLYAPNLLELEVAQLQAHPNAGLVHTALYCYDVCENRSVLCQPYPQDRICTTQDLWQEISTKSHYHISTPCVLIRRQAAEKAGLFDLRFQIAPDLDLWWRILEHYDLAYIAQPLLAHRIYPEQMSASSLARSQSFEETRLLLQEALERHSNSHPHIDKPRALRGIQKMVARGYLRLRLHSTLLRLLHNPMGHLIFENLRRLRHRIRGDLQGLPAWTQEVFTHDQRT